MKKLTAYMAVLVFVLPAIPEKLNAQADCSQCTPCQKFDHAWGVCNSEHDGRMSEARKKRDRKLRECDRRYKEGSTGNGICKGSVKAAYAAYLIYSVGVRNGCRQDACRDNRDAEGCPGYSGKCRHLL